MMKVRNKSSDTQHFTGIPTFAAGEVRDVDEALGEYLLGSPHMERVEEHAAHQKKMQATSKDRSFKAVERE